MLYQYNDKFIPVTTEQVNPSLPLVGYITLEELPSLGKFFDFDDTTMSLCKPTDRPLRSIIETHDDYTFGLIDVIGDCDDEIDWIAVFAKKNVFLLVDIKDADGSTRAVAQEAFKSIETSNQAPEKFISIFFEKLIYNDVFILSNIRDQIMELEDTLVEGKVEKDFNITVFKLKKHLQRLINYYDHCLDFLEALQENDNDILEVENRRLPINNIVHRVERLREDTILIKTNIEHIQSAYFSYLDLQLNKSMRFLTLLTAIFFPLTIIVGWYGMNFRSMPEFEWQYGYLYVILLSLVVVIGLIIIGKFKNWFK
jgi:magnesium transporter